MKIYGERPRSPPPNASGKFAKKKLKPLPPMPRKNPESQLRHSGAKYLGKITNLKKAQTPLDLIIITFCKNLQGYEAREALDLFCATEGTRLKHELYAQITKGERAGGAQGFQNVVKWLQDIFANVRSLSQLIIEEKNATQILHLFIPGLYSECYDVVLWTCRILSRLAFDFYSVYGDNGLYLHAWRWFASKRGGMDGVIYAFRQHRDIKLAIYPVIDQFCRHHYKDLFSDVLRVKFENIELCLAFICEILDPISANQDGKIAFIRSNAIDYLLDLGLTTCSNLDGDSAQTESLNLLTKLWGLFPEQVGAKEDICHCIIALLKKGCRNTSIQVEIIAHACLFELLEQFSLQRYIYAPLIYKTLIFSLIESRPVETLSNFVIQNMCISLERLNCLPVGLIVEPFVRQVVLTGFENTDFDLCVVLAKHSTLEVTEGLILTQFLGAFCVNETVHARLASIPFLVLINRFYKHIEFQNYVKNFAISSLGSLVKEENIDEYKPLLVVEIMAKIINLDHTAFNSILYSVVCDFLRRYGDQHKLPNALLYFFPHEYTGIGAPTPDRVQVPEKKFQIKSGPCTPRDADVDFQKDLDKEDEEDEEESVENEPEEQRGQHTVRFTDEQYMEQTYAEVVEQGETQ
eukprot:Nk52_evm2s242 gene=Nk52_evmTU2s242